MTRSEAKRLMIVSTRAPLQLNLAIDRIYDDLENRSCKNCKFKYVVDSMTEECRNDNSPIEYLDLECFPKFSCSEWELKC